MKASTDSVSATATGSESYRHKRGMMDSRRAALCSVGPEGGNRQERQAHALKGGGTGSPCSRVERKLW
jgi:hypothetical protein